MALLRSRRLPKPRLLLLPVLALLPLLRAQPVPPPLCGLDYLEDTDTPGQWTPRPYPPLFDTMTAHETEQLHGYECPDFYHLCARRSDADLARSKALSMWDWQPAGCTLPPFNGDAFYARFLQSNVTLLMVGDSITQEHYVSLTCQLSKHIVTRTDGGPPLRHTAALASGATIDYVRENHLVHADTHLVLHTRHADATDDHYPWVTYLPSSSHDVLILNTGAHWADKMSIMSIHNVLNHLAAHFKGVVIYRGAYEGYDRCEQHAGPVAAHDVPTSYNWGLLALYNDHWRTAIRRLRRKGHPFFYVDVATPLRHRPDARSNPPKDCFHMCMPGPIDLFNQVAIAGPPVAAAPGDDVVLTTCLAAALLPFFQQALPVACDALMSERDTALALLDMGRALRTRQPEPAPPPVLAPHQLQPKGSPEFTVKRPITCATYLRRLHVTSEMAERLLPDMKGHVPFNAMRSMPNSRFFKRSMCLLDVYGRQHEVSYECLVSCGQRHARLSAGWGPLMRALKARIGDAVVLKRYGVREEGVLHVFIERE